VRCRTRDSGEGEGGDRRGDRCRTRMLYTGCLYQGEVSDQPKALLLLWHINIDALHHSYCIYCKLRYLRAGSYCILFTCTCLPYVVLSWVILQHRNVCSLCPLPPHLHPSTAQLHKMHKLHKPPTFLLVPLSMSLSISLSISLSLTPLSLPSLLCLFSLLLLLLLLHSTPTLSSPLLFSPAKHGLLDLHLACHRLFLHYGVAGFGLPSPSFQEPMDMELELVRPSPVLHSSSHSNSQAIRCPLGPGRRLSFLHPRFPNH